MTHTVRPNRAFGFLAVLALTLLLPMRAIGAPSAASKWVASWGQAMTSDYTQVVDQHGQPRRDAWGRPLMRAPRVTNTTLRQNVTLSEGGDRLRIRLSNVFGREPPLTVSAAHVAIGANDTGDQSAIKSRSDRPVSFDGGKASITIAPGGEAVSDPIDMHALALSHVIVSLYFAEPASLTDSHPLEQARVGWAVDGNATRRHSLAQLPMATGWKAQQANHMYVLSGVEVGVPAHTRGIVAIGDSITDGALASTPSATWPAVLARLAQSNGQPAAVVNAGISANELTTDQIGWPAAGASGLKRFLRDAVDRPGVTDVIVLFGANDINRGIDAAGYPTGASAGDIITSMRMLADVAHQHHLRIYAGTIMPFAGYPGWYSPQREAVRLQVNRWIRDSDAFDGVIDFAAAVAGAYRPPSKVAAQKPLPVGMASVCAGDAGLHPNDRGYAVMGTLAYNVLFHAQLQPTQGCH